jgi:hypothetical protein
VVRGPDGALYVSELTGFPFPLGGARIYRVAPGSAPTVYATGFTNVIDLEFDSAGNLYVLEIDRNGLAMPEVVGRLASRPSPNSHPGAARFLMMWISWRLGRASCPPPS